MKFINLFKSIPFLITLIIILILNINNQKEYTKLKILIWNTPSLTLGTYLALSTGTGFILSYIITNNLVNSKQSTVKQELKYKVQERKEQSNYYNEDDQIISYDNTLIERDIKEPSPTLNASFRVIGKVTRNNELRKNNQHQEYYNSDYISESEDQYTKEELNYKNDSSVESISNDWDDYTYYNW